MTQKVKAALVQLQDWLHQKLRVEYHADVEDYLQQSTDMADLEHRIRMLRDRGYAL